MSGKGHDFDVIVIGGGHAGAEAAWGCAQAGCDVALITLDPSKIGVMSCNPAIGGLAKGQMVREIDALGGLMGLAADATGIMFKVLNTSKGAAVRGPRAQCDKHAYARCVREFLESNANITIVSGAAERFIIERGLRGRRSCRGVVVCQPCGDGPSRYRSLRGRIVILTTGTFMRGLMHEGERKTPGGRAGEAPATGIAATLGDLGFELGRLKTGTPPRLRRSTIDWQELDAQYGDDPPRPFSDLTDPASFPALDQVECRVTSTTPHIHQLIRANLHRAPMYSGAIESVGPRYCPSIEDKVVRFADRSSHHVFLEPESHESDWVYCNGISTSLPLEVQAEIVRAMAGCSGAEIVQPGYAVEYDMVRPHQIHATCETKLIEGLFLAGQINGTSGYEEAAGQGILAALNAVARLRGDEPVILGRERAYIGVMMDDLVTRMPREPYRMFTSRAEHRLLLRADNAADRLTELGRALGIVGDIRWERFGRRRDAIDVMQAAIDTIGIGGQPLAQRIKRPGYTVSELRRDLAPCGVSRDSIDEMDAALVTVLAERQYAGYIVRQRAEIRRRGESERRRLPETLDYHTIVGLRAEATEALARHRPATLGQAGRLEGVNPADLTLVLVAMQRHGKELRRGQAAAV